MKVSEYKNNTSLNICGLGIFVAPDACNTTSDEMIMSGSDGIGVCYGDSGGIFATIICHQLNILAIIVK